MNYENSEILIFKDTGQLSNFVIEKWMELSEKSIKNKGHFTVALSGGETPITLYQNLVHFNDVLPWENTDMFQVDERFVPHKDRESNYHMLNQTLLRHIRLPKKNIHPIPVKENTPQDSAIKYATGLTSYFKLEEGEFPKFNLILLGIGEDGHTASLFPDTPSLKETGLIAVAVLPPDTSKQERVSLTLPVINNADNIFFLISGRSKAKVVNEILKKRNTSLPAALVRPKEGKLFFLMDKEAGALISK